MNAHEIALAARFVEALDASASTDLVDPAYLTENRLFVRVAAEGALRRDADRLAREIDGPARPGPPGPHARPTTPERRSAPAVLLNVVLSAGQTGETRGRVVVSQADAHGPLGAAGQDVVPRRLGRLRRSTARGSPGRSTGRSPRPSSR